MLLKPVQVLFDRGLEQSASARALCADLDGRSLGINTAAGLPELYLTVADGRLLACEGRADEPDAWLSGSPVNLLALLGSEPEQAIRAGRIQISGDTEVAENFQALLNYVRPDPEEELSRVTGDAVAHEAGRFGRGLLAFASAARSSIGRSVAEYLTEESRDLISRTEHDEFCAAVDDTALAVERLEAKLKLLRTSDGNNP